jgi:hypothetical protein
MAMAGDYQKSKQNRSHARSFQSLKPQSGKETHKIMILTAFASLRLE